MIGVFRIIFFQYLNKKIRSWAIAMAMAMAPLTFTLILAAIIYLAFTNLLCLEVNLNGDSVVFVMSFMQVLSIRDENMR